MSTQTDNERLIARAVRAYFVTDGKDGSPEFPSLVMSEVEELGSHLYVVLRNVNGILAVYRVRNDGILKRLKRYPDFVEFFAREAGLGE